MLAAQGNQAECCQALCEDPRTDIRYFWVTPSKVQLDALRAALYEGHTAAVQALVSSGRADGPDLSQLLDASSNSSTPVCFAAELGHASCVKVLLDAKSDPTIRNSKGQSALQVAMSSDSTEIIMLLVSGGVDATDCFTEFRQAQIRGD
eukprot:5665085-Amphidinium_carterae.1